MDEYVNEGCPELCSTEHQPAIQHGHYTCPESDRRYVWCNPCQDWYREDTCNPVALRRTRGKGTTRTWICDPATHNYVACQECNNWLNRNTEAFYPCYNNTYPLCSSCWDNNGGCDCPDCNDDRWYDEGCSCEMCCDGYEHISGESVTVCPKCGSPDRHLDELNEMFFCPCSMQAVLAKEPDHPFRLHAQTPVLA